MRETDLQAPMSVKKEEEVLQLQAHGKHFGDADSPPAAHGGPCQSRYPHCGRGGPHAIAGGHALMEAAAHREPGRSRLLAGAVAWGEEPTQDGL